MLEPHAAFTFRSRLPLTQWYGHVALLPGHAVGQWFCVERASGTCLWERPHDRANTFVGVDDGVIIASEMRSDGPWTLTFGAYAISLENGELLWTSADADDAVFAVVAGECFCENGRVLEAKSGREIRRVAKSAVHALVPTQTSDAQKLYDGKLGKAGAHVALPHGSLAFAPPEKIGGFRLRLDRADGGRGWVFDLASTGLHMSHVNFYSFRFAGPHVYLIASEEPTLVPNPKQKFALLPNPAQNHLLALDLSDGTAAQDIVIEGGKHSECRIEDADDRGVLVSTGKHELRYFERTA